MPALPSVTIDLAVELSQVPVRAAVFRSDNTSPAGHVSPGNDDSGIGAMSPGIDPGSGGAARTPAAVQAGAPTGYKSIFGGRR
jgi:hypothetical protein